MIYSIAPAKASIYLRLRGSDQMIIIQYSRSESEGGLMETVSIYDVTAAKRKVKKGQRSWKYLRDVNSLDANDLNKTAIIDGNRKYTFGQMFREWERYASVFTAMEMTEEQNARVGVLGSSCSEVIFSFYGLNMVGAQVSLVASWSAFNFTRIEETILQEKLTDFIVTDDIAQPDLVRELLLKRKKLGLRHVIIIHVSMEGVSSIPLMTASQELKSASMKMLYAPICMETLLASYGSHPVYYAKKETDDTAFIIHTTGTTSGTGKPVPLSDSALNSVPECFMNLKNLSLPFDHLVTAIMLDLSNSFAIIDQVHLALAMGATVVAVPLGLLNPWFYRAISSYGISFLFSASVVFERWLKMPEDTDFDFSSLKFVALGGMAVSAADKKRYHEFIETHGGENVTILNGYGLSELGGACCLSTPDLDDESIGYPLPGISVRIYDEDNESFFSTQGEPCEGVLYLNSPSMASQKLDGKDVIRVETIDRKSYVCTNDLVRMDKDGRITYLGRANRFFLSEGGRKYESGRVETEFSRQKEIESCAIAPVFNKHYHDTVPMLCVKTLDEAGSSMDVVLSTLRRVFIEEKTLPEEYLPSLVMLAETLPRNANGKIDLYQLNQGKVSGEIYNVEPVRENDQLKDFNLTPCEESTADPIDQVIDAMSADIKSRMPGIKPAPDKNKKETVKEIPGRLYETLDSMRYMHQQFMNNRHAMLGQWFPWTRQFRASEMPRIKDPLSDIEKMISEIKTIAPIMQGMMPGRDNMMSEIKNIFPFAQGMMPGIPFMMKNMTPPVFPGIHEQAAQMMSRISEMNQKVFEMSQRYTEQMMQGNDKLFGFIMKLFTPWSGGDDVDVVEHDDAEFVDAEYVEAVVLDQDE